MSGKDDTSDYSQDENAKKKSRKNNTTPPTIGLYTTSENTQTPKRGVPPISRRSIWVHSPEDRRALVDEIVQESINDLKKEMTDKLEDKTNSMRIEMTNMTTEITTLKRQLIIAQSETKQIKKQLLNQERINKQNNIKLGGIYEHPKEGKFDCKRKVISFFKDAGIDIHPQAISTANRIGFKSKHNSRSILITFLLTEDKEFVLAKGNVVFKKFKVWVDEDLPQQIENNIKELRPIMQSANHILDSRGTRKYRATLQGDILTVNNHKYTVETMNQLPHDITPELVATPTKGNVTAFFTKRSPLSNHHPSEMKIDNRKYCCNEQYYMERKALTFADTETAKAIMATQDPAEHKKLGRRDNIKGFDVNIWNELKIETMEKGLRAKFLQNSHLQDFLLQTKTNTLIEANPRDKFWGAGLSVTNHLIWKKNSLLGYAKNHLGCLLMNLRRELKHTVE